MINPSESGQNSDAFADISAAGQMAEDAGDNALFNSVEGLNAKYQDDVAIFKADVIGLFHRYGVKNLSKPSFLIYNVDGNPGNNSIMLDSRRELLIMACTLTHRKHPGLVVRMLLQEDFLIEYVDDLNEKGHEYLVIDTTVDEENDAQYFVDSFPARKDPPPKTPLLPVFVYDEGKLCFPDIVPFSIFTPFPNLQRQPSEPPVFPFGHYSCIEDRIHALHQAREQIDAVFHLTPRVIREGDTEL